MICSRAEKFLIVTIIYCRDRNAKESFIRVYTLITLRESSINICYKFLAGYNVHVNLCKNIQHEKIIVNV